MREEVIGLIRKTIGREISDSASDSKHTLYEDGINSNELVRIVIEIEQQYDVTLDEFLDKLSRITLEELIGFIVEQQNN